MFYDVRNRKYVTDHDENPVKRKLKQGYVVSSFLFYSFDHLLIACYAKSMEQCFQVTRELFNCNKNALLWTSTVLFLENLVRGSSHLTFVYVSFPESVLLFIDHAVFRIISCYDLCLLQILL